MDNITKTQAEEMYKTLSYNERMEYVNEFTNALNGKTADRKKAEIGKYFSNVMIDNAKAIF